MSPLPTRPLTNERMFSINRSTVRFSHIRCRNRACGIPRSEPGAIGMRKSLTSRQQTIFDFIAGIIRSRGAPPTIREIMVEFGISSTNGVRTTLAALEKKGYIRRHPRLSRGIELVDFAERLPRAGNTLEIPLLGHVAAGHPDTGGGERGNHAAGRQGDRPGFRRIVRPARARGEHARCRNSRRRHRRCKAPGNR